MMNQLEKLRSDVSLKFTPPPSEERIIKFEEEVHKLPKELKQLYKNTNGLVTDFFTIFPISNDDNDIKNWDDLFKNNSIKNNKYDIEIDGFYDKSLIFADIGGGKIAFYYLEDESIWFEENDKFSQTDLSLAEFIKCLYFE